MIRITFRHTLSTISQAFALVNTHLDKVNTTPQHEDPDLPRSQIDRLSGYHDTRSHDRTFNSPEAHSDPAASSTTIVDIIRQTPSVRRSLDGGRSSR
jgi:hypothetical protein